VDRRASRCALQQLVGNLADLAERVGELTEGP